ncbi:MAG: hypothetical protein Q9216_003984 [Gyalolechia sp. 2 TL-2023]
MAPRHHNLAIRPAHEAYRSMPGTPLGMDPQGANSTELAAAMNHVRSGLEVGDYFLGAPKISPGPLNTRSPMMPVAGHHWDHNHGYSAGGPMTSAMGFGERDRERDLEDYVRKENRVVALLNGAILPPARYAQVHPMRSEDGSFPADFKSAKTVGVMRTLDSQSSPNLENGYSQLDRIMQAYRIPLDLPHMNLMGHHARDATSSTRVRQNKLHNLLEFLGAYHLLEFERETKRLQY